MKLTAFTDYSLRVLMYLAVQPGGRATIADIAKAFGVSENHLVKVVHFLGKAGWLATVRGKGGGIALAKPAAEIRIDAVVRDTEGDARMAECFGDGKHAGCCIDGCCQLSGVLSQAVRAFYAVLERFTLADVVRNRDELARILFVPNKVQP